MRKDHFALWGLLLTLVGPACNPEPTSPAVVPALVKTVRNADGTTTVSHMVDGMREGRTLVYLPNGEIGDILYFHRDKAAGIERRFYDSGQLMSWEQARGGFPHGKSYRFHETGGLKDVAQFIKGKHTGRYLLFYEQPRNRLYKRIDFVIGEGEEWPARYVVYDTLGRVTERYGYLEAKAERDTVSSTDSLTLHLRVRYPQFPLVLAVVGNYDAQFRLRDSASVRLVRGRDHAVTVRIPATQRGAQVVRGYLSDFREIGPGPSKRTVTTEEQRLYFAYPYFVR
ncbi:MAG TPA: hypothetical protein VF630_17850 [Hymenobacter sp.]|jgi:hypothetical protein